MTGCEQLKPNYDAYALGVLEGEERAALEVHLARGCPDCSTGVSESRTVVAQLAYLAPDAEPPAALRRRVLEAVRPQRRNPIPVWAWAAAAVFVMGAVFTAIETRQLQRELAALNEQLEQQRARSQELEAQKRSYEQLRVIVSDPTRELSLKPAPAAKELPAIRAYWKEGTGVVLVADNVPAPPVGRTFQLWVIPKSGSPASGGIFRPDRAGKLLVIAPTNFNLADAQALAITEEPAGGRPQPTSAPPWVGPLS